MKYRIFLSDFDGTLVRADGTISETNKRAIAEYRAAGGIFAVCTGRMLTSILPRLKELGIRDGDWVWIENERGRIKQVAHVDQAIIKGTVQAMPSWWYPELPAEDPWLQGAFISNVGCLVDGTVEGSDEATGTWTCRGLLCRVYPCIDPKDRTDMWVTGDQFIEGDTYFNQQYNKLGCRELKAIDWENEDPGQHPKCTYDTLGK